jgi:putative membrane protein
MSLLGTGASLFADISLLLEAVILAAFIVGWRYAKRKRTNEHYKIMTTAFILNLLFVGSYMIRSLLKSGSTHFSGPENIKAFIYLPTVIVHGIASVLAFILAGYTVYYGYSHTTQKKKRVFTQPQNRSKHRILGILTISTWTLSFVTGTLVYLLLYVLYSG